MYRIIFGLALSLASEMAGAEEIASDFSCSAATSPEDAVKILVNRGVIPKQPFIVGDSISYYSVRPRTTAFGFPLIAVFAYQLGSAYFSRGPGTAPSTRIAYVVQASVYQVAEGLRGRKYKLARLTSDSFPQIRVEGYNSEYEEPLPRGADSRFAYTHVTCFPE